MSNMDTWPQVDNPTADARPLMTNDLGGAPTEIQGPAWSAIAEVTALDVALGRLAVEGVELGDTGWRDIAADLVNGWTAGLARIRRVGPVVYMPVDNLDPSGQTAVQIYLPTAGFRSVGFSQRSQVHNFAGTFYRSTIGPTNVQVVAGTGVGNLFGTISWLTDEAWPTSLPGT